MRSIELSTLMAASLEPRAASKQNQRLLETRDSQLAARSSPAFPPSPASSQYAARESGSGTSADPHTEPSATRCPQTPTPATAASAPRSCATPKTSLTTPISYHPRRPSHRPAHANKLVYHRALVHKPRTR